VTTTNLIVIPVPPPVNTEQPAAEIKFDPDYSSTPNQRYSSGTSDTQPPAASGSDTAIEILYLQPLTSIAAPPLHRRAV